MRAGCSTRTNYGLEAPIAQRTMGISRGWQMTTTRMPPKIPTRRSMAGRISGEGAAPWIIARMMATPACSPT